MRSRKKKERRRTHLSIEERVTIIKRLENGEKPANLAKEYKITQGAISVIKKAKEHILRQRHIILKNQGSTAKKRFTVEDTCLEKSLYKWFIKKTRAGDTVTVSMLQKKAVELNTKLNGSSTFKGSAGFVNKFKKRHNIRNVIGYGERLLIDTEISDRFCHEFAKYIRETKTPLSKIYNADTTGLYWKMLPDKSPPTNDEGQSSEKIICKDRVALMMCTNATGSHKLPLLVIGKYDQQVFKNVHSSPVFYTQGHSVNKNATMDSDLMLRWYQNIFLPEIERRHGSSSQQCILLLEDSPYQLTEEQFNTISQRCKVIFLPPNEKLLIQPLNQGIILKCKQIYKSDILRIALTENTSEDPEKVLESFDLLRFCYLISSAWNAVTDDTIKNGWKYIVDNTKCIGGLKLGNTLRLGSNNIPFEEVIAWLNNDNEGEVLSDEEATSSENDEEIEETESVAENEIINNTEFNKYLIKYRRKKPTKEAVTARDAVLALNTVLNYVNQTEDPCKDCDCLFKLWLRTIKELQNT